MVTGPVTLVGRELSDPSVESFFASYDDEPERYDDTCGDGEYHLFLRKDGWEVFIRDGRIVSLFLYGGLEGESCTFCGALPHGISFSDSREAIRKKLGEPDFSRDVISEHARSRDIYGFDDHCLIVYYLPDFEALSYLLLTERASKSRTT